MYNEIKPKLLDAPQGFEVQSYRIEVCYWRKANAIHVWFVDNIQDGNDDCKEYYVDTDKLQELVDTITEVLDDHSKAEELLPTQSGFFFGNTNYDIHYFKELYRTKEVLLKVINNPEFENFSFYYSSSW